MFVITENIMKRPVWSVSTRSDCTYLSKYLCIHLLHPALAAQTKAALFVGFSMLFWSVCLDCLDEVSASHSDYAEYDIERAHPSMNPVEFEPTIVLVRLRRSQLWWPI